MSEFITEINQLLGTPAQKKLGTDLRELALQQHVVEHLHKRHLLGVLKRHGDKSNKGEQKSQSAVFAAYKKHNNRELGVFVLSGYDGNTLGMATVDPTPRLRKQKVSVLPPWLVPKMWQEDRSDVTNLGPEVCAWVAPGEGLEGGKVLTQAYKLLMQPNGPAQKFYEQHAKIHGVSKLDSVKAWTIEPLETQSWVHSAIRPSVQAEDPEKGYEKGYFDDGESVRVSPPTSLLYIARASNPESAIL